MTSNITVSAIPSNWVQKNTVQSFNLGGNLYYQPQNKNDYSPLGGTIDDCRTDAPTKITIPGSFPVSRCTGYNLPYRQFYCRSAILLTPGTYNIAIVMPIVYPAANRSSDWMFYGYTNNGGCCMFFPNLSGSTEGIQYKAYEHDFSVSNEYLTCNHNILAIGGDKSNAGHYYSSSETGGTSHSVNPTLFKGLIVKKNLYLVVGWAVCTQISLNTGFACKISSCTLNITRV